VNGSTVNDEPVNADAVKASAVQTGASATDAAGAAAPASRNRANAAKAHERERRRGRGAAMVALLLMAIAFACVLSIVFGSRNVSAGDIVRAIATSSNDISAAAIRLRIPRTVLGILVGASLAVAGALMQGVARNPLADPSILGLNTGAAFAIVCSIAFVGLSTPIQYVWVALLGSSATAAAVWAVGSMGRSGPTPLKLTLAGAVLSAVLSSLTAAILLPRVDVISTYRYWQVGGLSGARFNLMLPIVPLLLAGFVIAFLSARSLNTIALGDELAVGLGLKTRATRVTIWVGAVLLCAGATSLAGPIGFVGLVVPHAARLIVGSDYRRIMAASALMGPLLLLVADVVGRIITRPADVEVGIVTALIGAPVFVTLVRRRTMAQV
jgi:iron complex transport system permease protein